MFRTLFATILAALLTLPYGICFCELLQSIMVQKATLGDDENTPDDHEKDCPCKLRHAMASLHADEAASTVHVELLAPIDNAPAADVVASNLIAATPPTVIDQPLALIPCALRI